MAFGVALTLVPARAAAQTDLLYSVEITGPATGNLVTITSAGTITTILPLNLPLGDVDLAIACNGNTLYALNSFSGVSIQILTIQLTPPQLLTTRSVTLNGVAPNSGPPAFDYNCAGEINAEGLAVVGDQLVIGFELLTANSAFNCHSLSNMIGFLNPATGVITNPFDLVSLSNPLSANCRDCPFGTTCTPNLACRADIDGMVGLPNGHLLVVDNINDGRFNDPPRVAFVDVSWPATPTSFAEVVPGGVFGIGGPNDIALSCNANTFFGITSTTQLTAFNLANPSLNSSAATLSRPGTYLGLALSPQSCPPVIGFGLGTLRGRVTNGVGGGGLAGFMVIATPPAPNFPFRPTVTVITDANGNYEFILPSGPYNISQPTPILNPGGWAQTSPVGFPGMSVRVNVTQCATTPGPNFVDATTLVDPLGDPITDLTVTVAGGIARQGRTKTYFVCVTNVGGIARTYAPTLALPPNTTFVGAAPQPFIFPRNPNEVYWGVAPNPTALINPGATACYTATVMVPIGTPLGTSLLATARVPHSLDLLQVGLGHANTAVDIEQVRGPFDPNEKLVTPEGAIEKTGVLKYQINFQNVGNDTAFTVVIRDQLDPNLDLSSLFSGAGSAPYTLAIDGSELIWTFENINLPDSTADEAGSHGFVTFEVSPVPTATPGTEIHNQAAIYFDFNEPVITNTTTNVVDQPPVVLAPASQSVNEGEVLTFEVTVTDPDGQATVELTAEGSGVTAGGTFTVTAENTSGTFSWTPGFNAAASSPYDVTFTATNSLSGSASTSITVNNVDQAPVVTAPASHTVNEGDLLTFTVTAKDPDGVAISELTAGGSAVTAGGTFTADDGDSSGTFNWTPGFAASTGSPYVVTFTATNVLTGSAAASITVNNVDRAPMVTAPASQTVNEGELLTFTVTAGDPDGDAISALTAAGTAVAAGGSFVAGAGDSSGVFTWTPGFTGSAGSPYVVTFTATNAISGFAMTTITVTTGSVPMSFDLTPGTLNLRSLGHWVTAYLEPTAPFTPAQIDRPSIRINNTVAVDPAAPFEIGDHDGDGIPDLMVKFNRAAVELTVSEGSSVPVTVSGTVADHSFHGTDYIRVLRAVVTAPAAGAVLTSGTSTPVRWTTPGGVDIQSVAMLSSMDDGVTWNLEVNGLPNSGAYDWAVPATAADKVRVAVVLVEGADETGYLVNGVLGTSGAFSIEVATGVESGIKPEFALRTVTPNPSQKVLRVVFSLPDARPATIAVFNVSGRKVAGREVGSFGAGVRTITLGEEATLASGVYIIRLTQGGKSLTTRAVLVR